MGDKNNKTSLRNDREHLPRTRESVRLKNELLSDVSQEFRNTLALLNHPLKKLKQNLSRDQESAQPLSELIEKLSHLNRLADQLQDVARLNETDDELEVTEIEVRTLLQVYTAFFANKVEQRGIELVTDLPDYEVVQTMDPSKLKEILIILITNALQLTPEGDRIQLALAETEENLQLTISHGGDPISRPDTFDELDADAHIHPGKNRSFGVRLSIVRQLVDAHEGEMTVTGNDQEGTTILLTFPKDAESITNAKIRESALDDWGPYPDPATVVGAPLSPVGFNPDGDDTSILIVEDDPILRRFVSSILQEERVRLEVAKNGAEALKKLAITDPDLIISDIIMPKVDGFELVKKIRSKAKYRLTPIILVSSMAEEKSRVHGFNIGISDYLVKPFSESELKARVQNLLRQKFERDKYLRETDKQSHESEEQSFIKRLIQYIENHIHNETITIEKLSQSVNTSRRQLYRDLKSYTGYTPAEFVREVKLRKARRMLEENSKLTVAEVADSVGYNTAAHFSRIFKERFGSNPSQYKNVNSGV
ncbi:response regulator [Fodinibius sediminis]|uniref:histidine kinase n=1 Tax=Fodinibius sediminis TaxID=1214077 RepID=A0A521CNE7_9BACT|nr:response regulator [Fodinibius sediminis]SMO60281.1 Histidine kinase-, DNA gyrase B-, and HSP90-like ATPase [Fodinibius sediminis]